MSKEQKTVDLKELRYLAQRMDRILLAYWKIEHKTLINGAMSYQVQRSIKSGTVQGQVWNAEPTTHIAIKNELNVIVKERGYIVEVRADMSRYFCIALKLPVVPSYNEIEQFLVEHAGQDLINVSAKMREKFNFTTAQVYAAYREHGYR